MMRKGIRDLRTLTNGLDLGSQSVIEAILRKVMKIESKLNGVDLSEISLSDNDLPPEQPMLTRQYSIGTDCQNAMLVLRQRLNNDNEYKNILQYLIKLLKNIRSDSGNISYRRLKKDNSSVEDYILPHSEVISLLNFIGFVDDDGLFFMPTPNRDAVARTLTVLSELGKEFGIK
jgi:hypothetical protein